MVGTKEKKETMAAEAPQPIMTKDGQDGKEAKDDHARFLTQVSVMEKVFKTDKGRNLWTVVKQIDTLIQDSERKEWCKKMSNVIETQRYIAPERHYSLWNEVSMVLTSMDTKAKPLVNRTEIIKVFNGKKDDAI